MEHGCIMKMPPYPGVAQVMEVSRETPSESKDERLKANDEKILESTSSNGGWEAAYAEYCMEKEKELSEKDAEDAKLKLAKEATSKNITGESNEEDWALQYHNYCIEKEARLAEEDNRRAEAEAAEINENHNESDDWQAQYAAYLLEKSKKSEGINDEDKENS